MYCRKCYSDLSSASGGRCPKCGRKFDPARPRTYLSRPFPSAGTIVAQVVVTTVLACLAAYVVAFHQAARASGH